MADVLNLNSVRAKMTRAYAHVRELDKMLRPLVEPDPDRFVCEHDGDATKLVFKVTKVPAIDPNLAVIVGEVFYNLRSAYDHIANQLVRLDGRSEPTKRTQFPVRESRTDEDGNDRITNLRPCVSRRDILDALDAVQPYTVNPYFNSYLWAICKLCNIDKHRVLLVMVAAMSLDDVWYGLPPGVPSPNLKLSIAPLKDGDPVAWLDFGGTEAPADLDAHLGLAIKLNEGPPGSLMRVLPVIEFLDACIEHLAADINHMGFGYIFGEEWFAPHLPDGRLLPTDMVAPGRILPPHYPSSP